MQEDAQKAKREKQNLITKKREIKQMIKQQKQTLNDDKENL